MNILNKKYVQFYQNARNTASIASEPKRIGLGGDG